LHHWIWNKIHLEMHKPEHRSFSQWPVYKFLAQYHYLHHQHMDKNFNVVFPFADYILGTNVRANLKELRDMNKLGLLTRSQEMALAKIPVTAERELVGSTRR
jgi:sterol desaturase/sphingolipid hydroxylase (fatty acid hydroxylase superfamily)